ncbi:MAG: hypothetical protein HKO13_03195 [Sphingomonas sp.]|nr:hypothetical protein [Sphingomonas sp.]
MAEEFAWFAADLAFDRLVACHPLENSAFRNQATRLALCANLEGDIAAAATAYQHTDGLHLDDLGERRGHARIRFGYDTNLRINGERVEGEERQKKWNTMAEEEDFGFYYESIVGKTANQVHLIGGFYRNWEEKDDGFVADRRDLLMIFARSGPDDRFTLKSATIGEWSPFKEDITE